MKVFTPKRLIGTRKNICNEHSKKETERSIVSNVELKDLIKRLAELPEKSVRRHAFALNKKELAMLASYLPYNYYKVDMKNLFAIIRLRMDASLCIELFQTWQMSYSNTDYNAFLAELTLNNSAWKDYLNEKHLKHEKFIMVLKEQTVLGFMQQFYLEAPSSMHYMDRLQYYGLKDGTVLFADAKTIRLLFCSKAEFETETMEELQITIKKYGIEYLRLFLIHFLELYTLRELSDKKFMSLARIIMKHTGENGSEKWQGFFADVEYSIESKYKYWINIYKIDEIFGKDERSNFWRNYLFESVKKYEYSNSLVMEFKNYYVVEFLGRANGPMYVYEKADDYFDKKVCYWIKIYNNQEIRKKLFSEKNFAMKRMAHLPNPGWEQKFGEFLHINKVAKII